MIGNLDNLSEEDLAGFMDDTEAPVSALPAAAATPVTAPEPKRNTRQRPALPDSAFSVDAATLMAAITANMNATPSSAEDQDIDAAFGAITEPDPFEDAFPSDTLYGKNTYDTYEEDLVTDADSYETDDEEYADDTDDDEYFAKLFPDDEQEIEEDEITAFQGYVPNDEAEAHYATEPRLDEEDEGETFFSGHAQKRFSNDFSDMSEDLAAMIRRQQTIREDADQSWNAHHRPSRPGRRMPETDFDLTAKDRELMNEQAAKQREYYERLQQEKANRMVAQEFRSARNAQVNDDFSNITISGRDSDLIDPSPDYAAMIDGAAKAPFVDLSSKPDARLAAQERLFNTMEDVLVTMQTSVRNEAHQKRVRHYTNKAVFPKAVFRTANANSAKKVTVLFFLIIFLGGSIYAGLSANAYYWYAAGNGQTLTPLQALLQSFMNDYPFHLLPLDTNYFFQAAGIVGGIILVVGALFWATMAQNKSSRVGHEHGEKHIATNGELKKYQKRFMEKEMTYRKPDVANPHTQKGEANG